MCAELPRVSQGWKLFFCPLWRVRGCECVHAWGSLGPSEGAWGAEDGGMKRKKDRKMEEVSGGLPGKGAGPGQWPSRKEERSDEGCVG